MSIPLYHQLTDNEKKEFFLSFFPLFSLLILSNRIDGGAEEEQMREEKFVCVRVGGSAGRKTRMEGHGNSFKKEDKTNKMGG
mmetsp:Transcript_39542/g.77831  ORF Transcript_39542/g.77831 Transcript_39542/m.77831 type:complete len:82 (+) Transcript_39542:435-680(+)